MTAHPSTLDDVLLLADPRFGRILSDDIFPHRLSFVRDDWEPRDAAVLSTEAVNYIQTEQPRVVLFASVNSSLPEVSFDVVASLLALKGRGLFPETRFILFSHKSFSVEPGRIVGPVTEEHARHLEKIITYCRGVKEVHPELSSKFVYVDLPAYQLRESLHLSREDGYIFAGGAAARDFPSVIRAVSGLDLRLKVVAVLPAREHAALRRELEPMVSRNCELLLRDPLIDSADGYHEIMARSLFVVVPVWETRFPKGLTTIVEALCLGKAVVTTTNPQFDDYLKDGINSLRVSPGDVVAYRRAIQKLCNDPQARQNLEVGARRRGEHLTVAQFEQRLVAICREVLSRSGDGT